MAAKRDGGTAAQRYAPVLPDVALLVQSSSEPLEEGIFPLGLTWVLNPFPKTFSDESKNQGLVCVHMHSITQTQKDPDVPVLDGWMSNNNNQHAPSRKTERDNLYGWIKKWSHMQKSH